VQNSFQNMVKRNNIEKTVQEVFIFDRDFNLIVRSNKYVSRDQTSTSLLLNKTEINSLEHGASSTSLPFKGNDGNWYMWGFYRLNEEYYLAVRENASRLQKVEEFSVIFWYIGFGGVLITIIVSWIIANRITTPINRLIDFSSAIGKGKFSENVPNGIKGELQLLSNAMDKMKTGLAKNQKEKEEMLAQIAHEIRNPLGGIELLANLTKEDFIKKEFNYDYIDKILKEVYGLKEAITSYLNYSRPAKAEPKLCDIESVYDEIKSITTHKAEKKNCKMRFSFEFDNIQFDPSHLKNVLLNLVSNSIDSVNENGIVEILSKVQNSSKIISVKDNGTGISKDKIPKVIQSLFHNKN
jgi:nitrogen fixation/metabolism regulation signal transduction histidine kinase